MSKGISLHIGVNVVDPDHYNGWDGLLHGCENDATAMQQIADSRGFQSSILLSPQATTRNVIQAITQAASQLQAGDMFFITYSGHGGQIWDQSDDESDEKDETLCLFDRQYRDDEFNRQLARFPAGVRILWISDSCHAEKNFRVIPEGEPAEDAPPPPRALGLDKAQAVIDSNKPFYDGEWRQQGDFLKQNTPKIAASLVQLAACMEQQLSGDSHANDPNPKGVFTSRLLKVWNNGHFIGNYQDLIDQVVARIPTHWNQTPQMVSGGQSGSDFSEQKPFTI